MASTFELICHHTYSGFGGFPLDLSGHDSHGQLPEDTELLPDGVAPGSGAWRFPRLESRIRVPTSEAWQPLGGIRVEVTARRDYPQTHNQTLIAGHNSFSFYIANSLLYATFRTVKSTYPLQNIDGLISSTHALPELGPYRLPRGEWMTLGFIHDGLDTMELYVNGRTVARRTGLLAGVPPVGPLGVSIGNEPDRNEPLTGEIDEIKVWRLNPHIMDEQFFSRPVDKTVANCWERFLRSLAEALDRHPDCARLIQRTINEAVDRLRRTIIARGPETRERFERTSREYLQLWRAGKLDSPEMDKLFADWCTWLRLVDISIEDDPALQELLRSNCLRRVLARCEPLDCDPQLAALLQLIMRNCHQGRATSA